ncbi:MAG: TetR/AcrR family transcriptional regulator C-terminal domain-containing protein [Anaerovorax sp.]
MSKSLETKMKIALSFQELTQTKPIKKISIQEIVSKCGLNRQTFYYHFQDIYDLINWIAQEISVAAFESKLETCGWNAALEEILLSIQENKVFYLNIYKFLGYQRVVHDYREEIKSVIIKIVKEKSKNTAITPDAIKSIAEFYAPGVIHMILKWVRSDFKESPESLAERLNVLLVKGVDSAIEEWSVQ